MHLSGGSGVSSTVLQIGSAYFSNFFLAISIFISSSSMAMELIHTPGTFFKESESIDPISNCRGLKATVTLCWNKNGVPKMIS